MSQCPGVVVEPEEQRADQRSRSVLVPAKARHDAVRSAHVLDLDHHALAGLIGRALVLGDHAVEARAFEAMEPLVGERALATTRREVEAARRPLERPLQLPAALGLRAGAEIAIAFGEQVEGDEGGGRLGGELVDARGRRVQAEL